MAAQIAPPSAPAPMASAQVDDGGQPLKACPTQAALIAPM